VLLASPRKSITVIYAAVLLRPKEDPRRQRIHGVSLLEAREIFNQAYIVDQRNEDPEQYRAIGWCAGRLCSVIFEIRPDAEGEFYHLVTAWKATEEEEESYAESA
jgi:uncharacterized DUF497 family protein